MGNELIEILVKSARRPWALDRLLTTLEKNLKSVSGLSINIADDRTNSRYLSHLAERHSKLPITISPIPSVFKSSSSGLPFVSNWSSIVGSFTGRHVLVLEDDQWLSRYLDLDQQVALAERHGLLTLNLSPGARSEFEQVTADGITFLAAGQHGADLWTVPKYQLDLVTSPSRYGRVLERVLLSRDRRGDLWRKCALFNPISGTLFDREYWLELWSGEQARINENIQINRAIGKLRESANPDVLHAEAQINYFQTTYASTISSSHRSPLDWDLMNSVWSDSWMAGDLIAPESSADWSPDVLARELRRDSRTREFAEPYLVWVAAFEARYAFQRGE